MNSKFLRALRRERGASFFEYKILTLIIVFAALSSLSQGSTTLRSPFRSISSAYAYNGGGSATTEDNPASVQCDPTTGPCPVFATPTPTPPPGGWD